MTDLQLSQLDTQAPRLTSFFALRDFVGVEKRNLLRTTRTPGLLLYAVEPVMLLVIFRYILGGAIKVPGGDYVDFVVPAIFLMAVLVGAMTSAIGMAEDLKSGIIDRLRSLPMARSAVLTGRSLTDIIGSVLVLAIMIGVGVAVSFRFHGNTGGILLGLLLILAFGYSFCWMNAAIGIAVKDPASATNASTGPTFLLLFASSAIVPTSTLPGWLQPFARCHRIAIRSPVPRTAQASRVIILHAPRAVQTTSQAMMTQTATVVDSGMRSGFPLP
ncbi:MAG TPA: ABC transporter permease, partial [Isosphaeraceae bacterium]|nr:ABC transporter permease [Isosphaeraceae bacterium]